MAEAIGITSGLLAIVTAACKSSITLYELIKSFQRHPQRVLELMEELSALLDVLQPLTSTIESSDEVDLSSLKVPVFRCYKACSDFTEILLDCSSGPNASGTSFRGWVKIRCMGEDINGFKDLLSSYKQIISVALMDANL